MYSVNINDEVTVNDIGEFFSSIQTIYNLDVLRCICQLHWWNTIGKMISV